MGHSTRERMVAQAHIMGRTLWTEDRPHHHLPVSLDHVQSLAWIVTEGMLFLIRRTTTT